MNKDSIISKLAFNTGVLLGTIDGLINCEEATQDLEEKGFSGLDALELHQLLRKLAETFYK